MNTSRSDITLSVDQKKALDKSVSMILGGARCVTLGGYAGTGKTTITGEIVKTLRNKFERITFACFTGKAYKVLEEKLFKCGAFNSDTDYCGTIHALVYSPRQSRKEIERGGLTIKINKTYFDDKGCFDKYDLIVVDEASMITEDLYEKLLEFEIPILAIGDHGQLPPVGGQFNLMRDPDIKLTRIHRQAEDNPIIRVSVMAREDGIIPFGNYGNGCFKTNSEEEINKNINPLEWMIIAGTNKKRVERNKWARWKLGRAKNGPEPGDRVVCLKNIYEYQVFNGMTGTISEIDESDFLVGEKHKHPHYLKMFVSMDSGNDYLSYCVLKHQFNTAKPVTETITIPAEAREIDPDDFGHLWDYGYCLTAHKSQGSEFDNVIVHEERNMREFMKRVSGQDGWNRWLYTAVTRAKKQLIIVEN